MDVIVHPPIPGVEDARAVGDDHTNPYRDEINTRIDDGHVIVPDDVARYFHREPGTIPVVHLPPSGGKSAAIDVARSRMDSDGSI